jgi:hypothetical protein
MSHARRNYEPHPHRYERSATGTRSLGTNGSSLNPGAREEKQIIGVRKGTANNEEIFTWSNIWRWVPWTGVSIWLQADGRKFAAIYMKQSHVTSKSRIKGCLTTSTFGKIVISISCGADVIELLQVLLLWCFWGLRFSGKYVPETGDLNTGSSPLLWSKCSTQDQVEE